MGCVMDLSSETFSELENIPTAAGIGLVSIQFEQR